MNQTLALLLDAYREINSRKLFWIVIWISALVVGVFAAVGISPRGFSILWWEFDSPDVNSSLITPAMYYKMLFAGLGVSFWLKWFAQILALISTGAMIPDLIASGSVDLYVSKPISRIKLFLIKYCSGLLFVGIQVTLFTTIAYIVIGVRSKSWDANLFLTIPIVVLSFSYLYCVCALLGVLTRSAMTTILLTLLFWLMTFGISAGEQFLLAHRKAGELENTAYARILKTREDQILGAQQDIVKGDPRAATRLAAITKQRDELLAKKQASDPARDNMLLTHKFFSFAHNLLPKTGEIEVVLRRALGLTAEFEEDLKEQRRPGSIFGISVTDDTNVSWKDRRVRDAVRNELLNRSTFSIISGSLLFELVILSLATWVFYRRDF